MTVVVIVRKRKSADERREKVKGERGRGKEIVEEVRMYTGIFGARERLTYIIYQEQGETSCMMHPFDGRGR